MSDISLSACNGVLDSQADTDTITTTMVRVPPVKQAADAPPALPSVHKPRKRKRSSIKPLPDDPEYDYGHRVSKSVSKSAGVKYLHGNYDRYYGYVWTPIERVASISSNLAFARYRDPSGVENDARLTYLQEDVRSMAHTLSHSSDSFVELHRSGSKTRRCLILAAILVTSPDTSV